MLMLTQLLKVHTSVVGTTLLVGIAAGLRFIKMPTFCSQESTMQYFAHSEAESAHPVSLQKTPFSVLVFNVRWQVIQDAPSPKTLR